MNKFGLRNYLYIFPWLLMLFFATFSLAISDPESSTIVEVNPYNKALIIITFSASLMAMFLNVRTVMSLLDGRWVYVLFLMFIAASTTWSSDPVSNLRISAYYGGGAVISLLAVMAFRQNPGKLFHVMIGYSVFMIGASLAVVLFHPARGIGLDGRWVGVTPHANVLGLVSLISIWANASYLFVTKYRSVKALNVVMVILSFVALYGTDSATSMVISFFVVLLILGTRAINNRVLTRLLPRLLGVTFFIVLAGSMAHLLFPEVVNIDRLLGLIGRNVTFTGRTALWDMAMAKIMSSPFLGSGFQEYISVDGVRVKHFHNGYIDLMVRGGFIGLLFLVIFVIQILLSSSRTADPKLFLYFLIMLIAILIHNITEGSFGRGLTAFWLIFSFIYFYKAKVTGVEAKALLA